MPLQLKLLFVLMCLSSALFAMFDFLTHNRPIHTAANTWARALGCAVALSIGATLCTPSLTLAASANHTCPPAGSSQHSHSKARKPQHKASAAAGSLQTTAATRTAQDPLRQPVRQAIRQAAVHKPRDLKADIQGSVVNLRGWLYSQSELDRVKHRLLQVPGVTHVYTNRVRLWSSRASDKSQTPMQR